ncbi:MAG: DUF6049 family protein [Actinomycetota bacterium]|nr:DUF6049 family protein [Actinomycetota bacterium]
MSRRRTARHNRAGRAGGVAGTVLVLTLSLLGPSGLGIGGIGGLGNQPAAANTAARSAEIPAASTGSEHVTAPLSAFAETLRFAVSSVTPSVVTTTAGNTLTIRGTVTNITDQPVSDLIYRLQRGPKLASSNAVAQEIAKPSEGELADGEFRAFGGSIGAGRSTSFAVAGWIAGGLPTGLQITAPGVYPVMVNVNGTIDVDGVPTQKRLGELHLLVTVASMPPTVTAGPARQSASKSSSAGTARTTGVPMSFLWPVTSRPHRGVNGVFLDDSLATDVGPDGALSSRLDALVAAGLPAATILLAIDPMLLDELDAMAKGYRVLAPHTVQAPLTRTPTETPRPSTSALATAASSAAGSAAAAGTASTGTATTVSTPSTPEPNTLAGTGGPAAQAFLKRLRTLAKSSKVLVLPYSNPDTVAITRAGMGSTLTGLVASGRSTAVRVLGRTNLVTSVALPPDALVDPATVQQYATAGYTSMMLAGSSVTGDTLQAGVGTIATGTGSLSALLDDSALRPLLTEVLTPSPATPPGSGQTAVQTGAQALNAAVATIAQRAIDGDDRPIIRVPDSTIDTGGLNDLGGAVAALSGAGMVRAVSPTTLPTGTTDRPPITPTFPAAADGRLLSADYLSRLSGSRRDVSGAARAIDTGHSSTAATLMKSLAAAVRPLTSASLRTDRSVGEATLSTINSTVQYLRSGVTIRPTAGSYTLASADSPLVLTVSNTLPYPVLVKVRIDGGQQVGLVATSAAEPVALQPGQSEGIKIAVKVSRAGTFVVQAQLTGPDGRAWGAPVPLPIRSSAYGSLTIILIVIAGGLLLLMVIVRIWQRWRDRTKRRAEEASAGVDSTPGPAAGSIRASVDDDDDSADPIVDHATAERGPAPHRSAQRPEEAR